jgi:hypothetical protein
MHASLEAAISAQEAVMLGSLLAGWIARRS